MDLSYIPTNGLKLHPNKWTKVTSQQMHLSYIQTNGLKLHPNKWT